ncbi:MAG: glycoside hydrolase family 3 protein [Bacteroidetes bacterium]|nr:glycoside hydrolase family 3 protein [Bacteroidota bacterium]
MPRLELRPFETDSIYRARIERWVVQGMVCGFCIFNGTVEQAKRILATLQTLALAEGTGPLLFSCDAEWGLPMRLSTGGTEFPHALALAHATRPNSVRDAARATGVEMRAIGLHWSFAPVADVNSDPKNPIINIRSFGENAETVSHAAVEYAAGLAEAGIAACAKHFPGHGETRVDSHRALPVLQLTPEHFEQVEFPPFRALIHAAIPSVMTGHLAAPLLARAFGADLATAELPASVSPVLTQTLLREHLGYSGLIVTDSMEMGGLRGLFSGDADAAEAAVRAGNNLVLMPGDIDEIHEHFLSVAARDCTFARMLEHSARQVSGFMGHCHFGEQAPITNSEFHRLLAKDIAASAIDVIGEIGTVREARFYHIVADDPTLQAQHIRELQSLLAESIPSLRAISEVELQSTLGADTIVFVLERPRGKLLDETGEGMNVRPVDRFALSVRQQGSTPRCIISLGNPYLNQSFELDVRTCRIFTYSDSTPSIAAVVERLHTVR